MRFLVGGLFALVLGGWAHAAPTLPQAAVEQLRSSNPALRVTWSPERATPTLISGLNIATEGADGRARAGAFLAQNPGILSLFQPLRFVSTEVRRGRELVRFEQMHQGRPVVGRRVVVRLQDDRVVMVTNETTPLAQVHPATITAEQAWTLVARKFDAPQEVGVVKPVVLATGDQGVEGFEVELMVTPFQKHLVVRVNGFNGTIVGVRNRVIR